MVLPGVSNFFGRTPVFSLPSVQYVGADHGRGHILVSEEFLDGPDFVPVPQ